MFSLEICLSLDLYFLTRQGLFEGYLLGMKMQSGSLLVAVEWIAQDGSIQPLLGDPLYGNEKAARLHLHAEEITFEHPLTGKKITIKRKADF